MNVGVESALSAEMNVLLTFEAFDFELCHVLLPDALWNSQKEDLARMYRLFNRVPKGLEPVAEKFKKHVEDEGMKLVKEVTETAAAKKEKEKDKDGRFSTWKSFHALLDKPQRLWESYGMYICWCDGRHSPHFAS